MDGAQYLVQSQAVLHGQNKFGQQVAGMFADDGDAQNAVLARHRQHLHKAMRRSVGNGAVQVVDTVFSDFIGDAFFSRFLLVEADSRYLRVNERGPGNHRVIRLEALEIAKQCVDGGIPGLVRGDVGELVGSCYIASGKDIGVDGFQIVVGDHRALGRNAEFFQAVATKAGNTADRAKKRIEFNAQFSSLVFNDDELALTLTYVEFATSTMDEATLQINHLLSFKVLFQCKRYAKSVSPSEVRDFRGAMAGRADKGIIITTGTFTAEARREASRDGVPPIELIDGEKLIDLLESLELGLRPVPTYELDHAFFIEFRDA